MTKTLLGVLAAVATAALLAPAALAGQSIRACSGTDLTVCNAPGAATDGVYLSVTTGGGNRDFASVEVICAGGYDTVITVEVPAKGTGSSQVLYPPAGACTANLIKQMQIGKARVLATTTFTLG